MISTPEVKKNINTAYIGLAGEGEVEVTYLSDYGEATDMFVSRDLTNYITSKRFTPRVSRTSKFALRLKK